MLVDAEDGSETVLSSHQDAALRSPSFSSDGSMLAYVVTRGSLSDIYARMPGSSAPQAVLATDTFEHSPALSPDGKWLAYVEGGAGADAQVYIAAFPRAAAGDASPQMAVISHSGGRMAGPSFIARIAQRTRPVLP